MRQNKIRIFQEVLVTQMNYFVFYPLAMTLSTLFQDLVAEERPSMLIWMLGGLISFSYYFARKTLHNLVPLFAFHAAGLGVTYGLSFLLSPNSSVNRGIFVMVGIGFVCYSIYLRLMTEDFEDRPILMPAAVGIIAVSLFMQHYRENMAWDSYYTLSLILVVALFFIANYVKEYLNFLTVNASSSGILPEKEIFRSGLYMTTIYTAIGAAVLLMTSQLSWLKVILGTLRQAIYNVISFISSLFPNKSDGEVHIINDEKVGGGAGFQFPEPGERSPIWDVIEIFVYIILILGVLLLIFYGIKNFFGFANKMMDKRSNKKDGVIRTTEEIDVREKCEIHKSKEKKNRSLKDIFGFLDSGERIRQIYKKQAASFKPSPLMNDPYKKSAQKEFSQEKLSYYTVREMERYMNSEPFAEIYEKARYSNEECTPQDVKRMKEACR